MIFILRTFEGGVLLSWLIGNIERNNNHRPILFRLREAFAFLSLRRAFVRLNFFFDPQCLLGLSRLNNFGFFGTSPARPKIICIRSRILMIPPQWFR